MNLITPTEAAKILHLGPASLANDYYDQLLQPVRTPGGHRRYDRNRVVQVAERRNQYKQANTPKAKVDAVIREMLNYRLIG